MRGFDLWRRWLEGAAWAMVVFGVVLALFNQTAVAELLVNQYLDPVFFTEMTDEAKDFQAWIYAVLGATIAGWGVCMVGIVRVPFARREAWSWTILVVGLTLWFVVDTTLSAMHGVGFNVGFNTAVAVLMGLPLVMTRRAFYP
jgi:hypothetical protein